MFKPLLAATADVEKLTFPLIASPKIDGIRCVIHPDFGPVSRTLKPIPNVHVRTLLSNLPISAMDGEIVTYTNGKIDDFNAIQSKVMRADGFPDFAFHAFDFFADPLLPYRHRLGMLGHAVRSAASDLVRYVPTLEVSSVAQLADIEKTYVDDMSWEGVMLRRPDGPYKMGRSTAKEGILVKMKRFADDEAIIVGTIERMHNGNAATKDAFGRTKRSTAKANLVPTNSLGALSVRWGETTFEIGTGFTEEQRIDLWRRRDQLVGQAATFKYQGVGSKGAPRFPSFVGIRLDVEPSRLRGTPVDELMVVAAFAVPALGGIASLFLA